MHNKAEENSPYIKNKNDKMTYLI